MAAAGRYQGPAQVKSASEGAVGTVGRPSGRREVGKRRRILATLGLFCVSLTLTNLKSTFPSGFLPSLLNRRQQIFHDGALPLMDFGDNLHAGREPQPVAIGFKVLDIQPNESFVA